MNISYWEINIRVYAAQNVKIAQRRKRSGSRRHFPNQCFTGAIGMSTLHSTPSYKKCAACEQIKPASDFSKRKSSRTGLQSNCKKCSAEIYAAWIAENAKHKIEYQQEYQQFNKEKIKKKKAENRVNNREKIKAQRAKYRLDNLDRAKEIAAKYRAANPTKEIARCATYRVKNREKTRAAVLAWRKANPEAGRVHDQNYRARKRSAGGDLTPGLAGRLFKLQKGKCPCCKQPLGDDYHLDHIVPLARGGSNTDDNIQLLRAICNLQKHAKHPIDFMQSRGFLL